MTIARTNELGLFLSESEKWKIAKDVYFSIYLFTKLFTSSGRASDVGHSTFKSYTLDLIINVIVSDWSEIKTKTLKQMAFTCHRKSFQICPLFSWFMYVCSGNGISTDGAYFEFPGFQGFQGIGAGRMSVEINRRLKDAIDGCKLDTVGVIPTSKTWRYAACMELYIHHLGGSAVAAAHGGNYFSL